MAHLHCMTTLELTERAKTFVLNSALKVKMFVHNNPKEAEKEVEQWLAKNDVTIQHLAQSQSEKNRNFVFVITLFYRIITDD